jgi:cephalosporin hydroxylase
MRIDELYQRARSTPSDIWEHLELLSRLSSMCGHVTEFGVRHGISTTVLLHGRPDSMISYDIRPLMSSDELAAAAAEAGIQFRFCVADVLTVQIEPTDFLLTDTLHTFDQLAAELRLHAGNVRRFIAIHDTSTFGDRGGGEAGDDEAATKVGVWPAIAQFLRNQRSWKLLFHFTNNNGLTVLERDML